MNECKINRKPYFHVIISMRSACWAYLSHIVIAAELQNGTAQKMGRNDKKHQLVSETKVEKSNMMQQERSSSPVSSMDVSSDVRSPIYGHSSTSRSGSSNHENLDKEIHEKTANCINVIPNVQTNSNEDAYASNTASLDSNCLKNKNPGSISSDGLEIKDKLSERYEEADKYCVEERGSDEYYYNSVEDQLENGMYNFEKQNHLEDNSVTQGNISKSERSKYVKSVRSSGDLARSIGSHGKNYYAEVKENGINGDAQNNGGNIRSSERKDVKIYPRDARTTVLDSKIEHLENKIKMLEGELREAASVEAALYSVAAEHGSSMSKVHAPARRLSRLYFHACKENIPARRSGAAKSAVSGLALVAKACGNDVPR